MLKRVISGGQTGVDRAALDLAREASLACGGWCPKGRRAEDGRIHARYPLRETPSDRYAQRTEWNVRDAEGTLVLNVGTLTEGTALTVELAKRLSRPWLVVDLEARPSVSTVRQWLARHRIGTLNIAGPRESKRPGIYALASQFLRALL